MRAELMASTLRMPLFLQKALLIGMVTRGTDSPFYWVLFWPRGAHLNWARCPREILYSRLWCCGPVASSKWVV